MLFAFEIYKNNVIKCLLIKIKLGCIIGKGKTYGLYLTCIKEMKNLTLINFFIYCYYFCWVRGLNIGKKMLNK